MDIGCTLDLG